MSRVFLISDHHFGHSKVLEFESSRKGASIEQHDIHLVHQHNSRVTKRDTVWFLGDVGFSKEAIEWALPQMNGNKNLILGNHDRYDIDFYKQYFGKIKAMHGYKGGVLSHIPIHNGSLDRWALNWHGHIHSTPAFSDQHINCCVEQCEGVPLTLEEWAAKKLNIRES